MSIFPIRPRKNGDRNARNDLYFTIKSLPVQPTDLAEKADGWKPWKRTEKQGFSPPVKARQEQEINLCFSKKGSL